MPTTPTLKCAKSPAFFDRKGQLKKLKGNNFPSNEDGKADFQSYQLVRIDVQIEKLEARKIKLAHAPTPVDKFLASVLRRCAKLEIDPIDFAAKLVEETE